jgi:uracil-DNA glycosylase
MLFDISNIKKSWIPFFEEHSALLNSISESLTPYIHDLCPKVVDVLRVFELTELSGINVVIVGQDPYYNGSADGLAFSIKHGSKISPSLRNIYQEIFRGGAFDNLVGAGFDGNLNGFVDRVLLLNTALTTLNGIAGAHKGLWRKFTSSLITYISENVRYFVYLAWGKHAHSFCHLVDKRHDIIKTSHPSPLGVTKSGEDFVAFRSSGCFTVANQYLSVKGIIPIDWGSCGRPVG